jgi:DoxX-like family
MSAEKIQKIAGWCLSALIFGAFAFSASGKLMPVESMPADVVTNITRLGWMPNGMLPIGIIEIMCAVFFLVPRTAFLGAILLTGYLGGATATHVRIGDPFYAPVALGILVWVGYTLRYPEAIKIAFKKQA